MSSLPAREAFLRACTLDVAVRKPGNVSLFSAGHGMQAAQFLASAEVAAEALFQPGWPVGRRIEAAVAATRAAVGCNTNLGILLLCAPLACAAERAQGPQGSPLPLQQALHQVLDELSVDDAAAAFRAIAHANPGGLGQAPEQDVHAAPSVGLRQAMVLAADRDRIAAQYRDGYAEVFQAVRRHWPAGLVLAAPPEGEPADDTTVAAVQALYLGWLASGPDSHIVRKQGKTVAQNVMSAAQGWQTRPLPPGGHDADPGFRAWDLGLKQAGVNPGTSADLTVAALMLAGLGVR